MKRLTDNQKHIIRSHPDMGRRELALLAECSEYQIGKQRTRDYKTHEKSPNTVRTGDTVGKSTDLYRALVYLYNPLTDRKD